MLKLNLYFEHLANKATKASDYFDLILKKIKSDQFIVQNSTVAEYIPVLIDEIDSYEEEGATIFQRENRDFIHVSTLCVSFYDIPRDYEEVRNDIIKMFGGKAARYEVVEEGDIENGNIIK